MVFLPPGKKEPPLLGVLKRRKGTGGEMSAAVATESQIFVKRLFLVHFFLLFYLAANWRNYRYDMPFCKVV